MRESYLEFMTDTQVLGLWLGFLSIVAAHALGTVVILGRLRAKDPLTRRKH